MYHVLADRNSGLALYETMAAKARGGKLCFVHFYARNVQLCKGRASSTPVDQNCHNTLHSSPANMPKTYAPPAHQPAPSPTVLNPPHLQKPAAASTATSCSPTPHFPLSHPHSAALVTLTDSTHFSAVDHFPVRRMYS